MPVSVRINNQSGFPNPSYATEGSSGVDLKAFVNETISLQPMERMLVPTGIFLEMPAGIEAQIRPRSGLAIRQGITCLNTPGTIDSDYRGEIKIVLINLSTEIQIIEPGDRIAQMVFQKVERVNWEETSELSTSERSAGGFGSTGKN